MNTFEEYDVITNKLPVSLRNNRDRINIPITGLQQESGNIGRLLGKALSSEKLSLTAEDRTSLKDSLADVLWYVALLSRETGMSLREVANHSVTQLTARAESFDADRR